MTQATATTDRTTKRPRQGMALKLGPITPEIRRQAAAILEVLAGARSPTDAAQDLALSLPAYYKLESRAIRGLILACRPPGRGPRPSPELEATRLKRQCQKLQQELQRYQALARAAQRAAGLPAPAATPKDKDARGRRKRKPAVRAFRALAALKQAPEAPPEPVAAPAAAGPVAPAAPSV